MITPRTGRDCLGLKMPQITVFSEHTHASYPQKKVPCVSTSKKIRPFAFFFFDWPPCPCSFTKKLNKWLQQIGTACKIWIQFFLLNKNKQIHQKGLRSCTNTATFEDNTDQWVYYSFWRLKKMLIWFASSVRVCAPVLCRSVVFILSGTKARWSVC